VGRQHGPTDRVSAVPSGAAGPEALAFAAAAISRGETDSVVRADLLTTLAIFGKLAWKRQTHDT